MLRTGFGDTMQTSRLWAVICLTVLMGPLVGSLTVPLLITFAWRMGFRFCPKAKPWTFRNKMDGAGLLTNVRGGSGRHLTKMETTFMIRFKIQIS